jgi:DNA-binding MarR family transcriptional regulator
MDRPPLAPEDRLLPLLDKLRRLDLDAPLPEGRSIAPPQVAVLAVVASAPGCSLQGIARRLDLAPPTVSVTASRLERAGLLERKPDTHDGRALRIFLTAQGESLYRDILAARRAHAERLLHALPSAERHQLVDLLERVLSPHDPPAVLPVTPSRRHGITASLIQRLRRVWS